MTANLQIKLLDKAERKNIYKQHMKQDFPKNELRPLHGIEALVNQGVYYTYGIFEKDSLIAYAYFWEEKEREILLFDYFAVVSNLRNHGYGTEAMKAILHLCENKRGVILETENPEKAESNEERETRIRRISFYKKCGLAMSDVRIYLFGVEYCMMYKEWKESGVAKEIVPVMKTLYGNLLPRKIYKKMVKIDKV